MSAFRDQLHTFVEHVEGRTQAVFVGVTTEVQQAIVNGSALTGAPGQPVDTGFLKSSWIGAFITPTSWQLTTNVAYAPVIEEGVRAAYDAEGATPPAVFLDGLPKGPRGGTKHVKSTVGGQGSVKLTRAAFQRIVDHVAAEAVRS